MIGASPRERVDPEITTADKEEGVELVFRMILLVGGTSADQRGRVYPENSIS